VERRKQLLEMVTPLVRRHDHGDIRCRWRGQLRSGRGPASGQGCQRLRLLGAARSAPAAHSAGAKQKHGGARQREEQRGRCRAEIEGRADGAGRRGLLRARLEGRWSTASDPCGQRPAVLARVLDRLGGLAGDGSRSRASALVAAGSTVASGARQTLPVDVLRRRSSAAGQRRRRRHEKCASHKGGDQKPVQPPEHGVTVAARGPD
jgi:hypothetical protein